MSEVEKFLLTLILALCGIAITLHPIIKIMKRYGNKKR
jgi:hypothetical protein